MRELTKTEEAKQLYATITKFSGQAPSLGLMKFNDQWVWVGHGSRAELLSEMTDTHLSLTIDALKTRHPKEFRQPLEDEKLHRKLKKVDEEYTELARDRKLHGVASNIVHQIGDLLYENLPPEIAHKYFVDARQATNDRTILFAMKLIKTFSENMTASNVEAHNRFHKQDRIDELTQSAGVLLDEAQRLQKELAVGL